MYCISTYEQEDQFRLVQQQFQCHGMDVTFIRSRQDANPSRGVFQSHINAWHQVARNKSIEFGVIFEDHIVLHPYFVSYLEQILHSLRDQRHIHIIHLGGMNDSYQESEVFGLSSCRHFLTTAWNINLDMLIL